MDNRNLYLNGDIAEARAHGYDIVQLKYDGWWTRAECRVEGTQYFSETGRMYTESMAFPDLISCVLVGEMMRGTQWSTDESRRGKYFVYDISYVHGSSVGDLPYIDRYKILRRLKLPSCFVLVTCYPIAQAETVWSHYVIAGGYEGIVFRRTTSPLTDAIMRQKREYTFDGYVIGFEEGLGKHAGRLGAVIVKQANGAEPRVGGGFSDAEREDIWNNQIKYLGRPMEYTANAMFESGNVRHARFVRWREDKT